MTKFDPVATFRTGFAASRTALCLSAGMDAFDPAEPYTRLVIYNERGPNLWTFNEHDNLMPSVCLWHDPATPDFRVFAALSENGEVLLAGPQPTSERIPTTIPGSNPLSIYGYLQTLRQIGGHLFAGGFAGQVYRRDGPGHWVHVDDRLLQSREDPAPKYFIQAIAGHSERSIYIAGSEYIAGSPPRADHWNGEKWSRLSLPKMAGRLTDIFVESEEKVWMCGSAGTLLVGNVRSGFDAIDSLGAKPLFYSATKYQGLIYLGSNLGLFSFDPARPDLGFLPVRTGLEPELTDANVVQAVDDVLWSIGPKDVARLNGSSWERIHHPDNPRIGDISTG